jgi:hypothetical protein
MSLFASIRPSFDAKTSLPENGDAPAFARSSLSKLKASPLHQTPRMLGPTQNRKLKRIRKCVSAIHKHAGAIAQSGDGADQRSVSVNKKSFEK